jgi:hypothetical protein
LRSEGFILSKCYPFTDFNRTFCADLNLQWCKGLDGNNGEKLLTLLNDKSKRIQMENGVLEKDVRVGNHIYNILRNKLTK